MGYVPVTHKFVAVNNKKVPGGNAMTKKFSLWRG